MSAEIKIMTGKQPVPNAGTKSGPGREFSRTLGTGNFPDFSGKNLGPGKWHSGRQTSTPKSQMHGITSNVKMKRMAYYSNIRKAKVNVCYSDLSFLKCPLFRSSLQILLSGRFEKGFLVKQFLIDYRSLILFYFSLLERTQQITSLGSISRKFTIQLRNRPLVLQSIIQCWCQVQCMK